MPISSVDWTEVEIRRKQRSWYEAGLHRVQGDEVVGTWLEQHPLPAGPWSIVAIGKAAASMASGALRVMGDRITDGFLVTKEAHLAGFDFPVDWQLLETEHPLPGFKSLEAGQALIDWLEAADNQMQFLFLLSGGASSLIEALPPDLSLETLKEINRFLLESGVDIGIVNFVRQRLSLIKGGRLKSFLGDRNAVVLLISDVPGDDIRMIGSGLLASPLTGSFDDLPSRLRWKLDKLQSFFTTSQAALQRSIPHSIVARWQDAMEAAASAAEEDGFRVFRHSRILTGDAATRGRELVSCLCAMKEGVQIWGGETTVALPQKHGRGGRNQHVALAAALAMRGLPRIALLAGGTDGSDGPTEAAGAIVDGQSVARGNRAGFDAQDCLVQANSAAFLSASGDLLYTGPTGTNVMDLMIGCHY